WRLRAHNVGASCVGQGQARGKPPRHTSSDGQRWPGVGSPDTRATSAFAARSRGACMNLGVGAWAGETEQGAPSAGGCSPCHRLRHADEPWALAGWLERTSARYAAAVSPVTGSPSASAVRRATRDGPLCRTTKKPDAQTSSVDGVPSHEVLTRELAQRYQRKYGDPTACDADAAEEAQDTLRKVRQAMASGKPLFPDENDPDRKPDVGEAITAKVT